jgi:undecaprenyl-diphosphatase
MQTNTQEQVVGNKPVARLSVNLFWGFATAFVLLIIFIGGLNELIKRLVGRERPILERLAEATGFGFPSGHAMVSSSFYGLIGYLLWINLRGKWSGAWSIPVVTMLLLAGIGFSRIYLGVHYPSDVFAGFAAGGAWLAGCIMGIQGIRHYKGQR